MPFINEWRVHVYKIEIQNNLKNVYSVYINTITDVSLEDFVSHSSVKEKAVKKKIRKNSLKK